MNEQLTQLYKEIKDCKGCPKTQWASGHKEIGWGSPGEILFIGESPAFTSLTLKEGDSRFDKSFKSLLKEAGIYDKDYFFTNVVKFPPIRDIDLMDSSDRKHCYDHLMEEIELIDPVVIVTLGTKSANLMRDFIFPAKHRLLHPGAIKYGTITREQYVQKLKEINEIYRKLKVVKHNKLV
jgi:uracil-DNA glycosylase family 4